MKKLSIFAVLLIFVVVSCQKEQYKVEIVEEVSSLSVEEIVQLTNQEFLQTPESTADENQEDRKSVV